MFLDLDIVEFQDANVPYTNIVLNAGLVRQVQRIDNGVQSRFMESRKDHQERYEEFLKDATPYEQEDPQKKILPPSSVKELPSQGAVIYMVAPHFGTYYTVTPYEEVKAQMLSIGRDTNKEAE
jgi:hypothetical protein